VLNYAETVLQRPANPRTGYPKHVIFESIGGDAKSLMNSVAKYYLVSNGNVALGDNGNVIMPGKPYWSGLDTDLGSPMSGRYTLANGLYRRDFQRGITLVNPPQSAPVSYTLPQRMNVIGGGGSVTSVTLSGGEGIVVTY
jgi:hypothetical protein